MTTSLIIMLMYGIYLDYFTKYHKIGIMLIILFFVPYVAVIVSLYLWLNACPVVWECLAGNFWDSP